ncbi:peptide-methionine (S)-S-oxide reductase MsrA [Devosia nitrariae]|uniref:Peptide methionine sulfoxide reductase MsrA n=1 Tax=Devosia nitrariae TaxID=2071872 RepID=A0ABQ5VYC6_9HYPH|nr:peptide-methionine (S)-S-oxide reductase MsrA [Devosia nitrariae]GLQ52768.1 peptide methionine sulfoxide reductase MsrA [Devosia nitrariae]
MITTFLIESRKLAAIATAVLGLAFAAPAIGEEEPFIIPPPSADVTGETGLAQAVFAAGCFWGVQGVYQHVTGVTSAVSGYSGGSAETANYEATGTGQTGHAEAVEITYDPSVISYGELLHILFSVVHDPTQLNYQGPDHGPQYRSAIFPMSEDQKAAAEAYIKELDATGVYPDPIVTTIEPFEAFYPAEDYHQDFLTLHPDYPYIVRFDLPKIENLKTVFADYYRDDPVLVMAAN